MWLWKLVFDDPDGSQNQDATPDNNNSDDTTSGNKTFTQDDVNKMLAGEKRKHQENLKKMIDEAKALQAKATLTAQEREEFDKRIEQLNNTLLTKEEIAKKEKSKLQKQYDDQINELTAKYDMLNKRYTNETVVRALSDAATNPQHDAFNPKQIVALLQPQTRLVEVLDDKGNPTGSYEPKVKFQDTDESGKSVELDLTPIEAVKRMTELEEYANLFKGKGKGGFGGAGNVNVRESSAADIARRDPKEYIRLRKEGKIAL